MLQTIKKRAQMLILASFVALVAAPVLAQSDQAYYDNFHAALGSYDGQDTREQEAVYLKDIWNVCINELRADLRPGEADEALAQVNAGQRNLMEYQNVRWNSSNVHAVRMLRPSDDIIEAFFAGMRRAGKPTFAAVQICAVKRRLCQVGRTKYCMGRPYVPSGAYTAPQAPPVAALRPATSGAGNAPTPAPATPRAGPAPIDWQARGAAPGFAPNPVLAGDSRGWRSPDRRDTLPLYGPSQADLDTLTDEQKFVRREAMTLYQVEKENLSWRGHKLHYAANDMTQCIKVVPTGTRLEWGTSGKFKMLNTCSESVNASWCANRAECDGDHGNLWTLQPRQEWPIFFADPADPYIRVGACKNMGKPVPSDAQLARQGGVSTRHNDPPAAPGVGILPNHIC